MTDNTPASHRKQVEAMRLWRYGSGAFKERCRHKFVARHCSDPFCPERLLAVERENTSLARHLRCTLGG